MEIILKFSAQPIKTSKENTLFTHPFILSDSEEKIEQTNRK